MKIQYRFLQFTLVTALSVVTASFATDKATPPPDMILAPSGEFVMGDNAGEKDEKPARKIKVSAFYMDKYEVSQEKYEALMGTNPSKFKDKQKPVERLSWLLAIKYCNLRSLKENLKPCYDLKTSACDFSANGYRLPTEAEWEYACRAGTTGKYSFGTDGSKLGEYAWFDSNASKSTQKIGAKKPNLWGLFDMHGNVAEWCNDLYAEDAYTGGNTVNPTGAASGDERVLRGGSWKSMADACRSSSRASETPGLADACFGYDGYGFRCVRKAE